MRPVKGLLPMLMLCSTFVLGVVAVLGDSLAHRNAQAHRGVSLPPVCGASLSSPKIDSSLPNDVEGALQQQNRSVVQRAADIFSWQEFLALNWPARQGRRGEPNRSRSLGASGPRVWETWKETREVYLPDGALPPEWNASPQVVDAGRGDVPAHMGPSTHLLSTALQAVQSDGTLPPTLTDRHGHLVRYEVRMNRVLFDFIRKNGLYDGRKQAAADTVSFPNGSLLIKASWREMEPGEPARFLTTDAWIYDTQEGKRVHWRRRKMGLVGFHIVQKTPSAPQWIWSTFEQVDNVAGPHPSFQSRSGQKGSANAQTRPGAPNQVTRLLPIPAMQANCSEPALAADNVQELNRALQRTLVRQRSVLQYYELVNTQWPLPWDEKEVPAPATVFRTLPPILANTTMETFAQDTSSCMGCHAMARTQRTDHFVAADFTFTLDNARPQVPNTQVITPPRASETEWDRQNWPAIVRGKELTEHTYELLPQYVHAKLHCESCHLDAGRNPASAWWVGMAGKYPTLDKLQARINQCFERSMNGSPLPTAASAAELPIAAPQMHALITYMQWIDEQYQTKHTLPPHNGLKVVPKLVGDPPRGEENFLQKCAACHGKDGQGRYANNTYYRPALWGPHSFNSLAGLNKPEKLAAFLQANMPFGSGGVLSMQEAWDLTAFLGSQQRAQSSCSPR